MPPKRRRYGADDDEDWAPPVKKSKTKTKTGKAPLPTVKKKAAKAIAKPLVAAVIPPTAYVPVPVNLAAYEILVPAAYVSFADPADCPAATGDYMGCHQVTVTLGPKQQFGQTGTNATATFPYALADASLAYAGQYVFKSGHVLNADFGGPNAANNMTILTSSANTQQTKFDNNIKNARNALYNVYKAVASCGPTSATFFSAIGYGIAIDIQMGGGTWGPAYPDDCISNQMDLNAVVVNEAAFIAAAQNPNNFASPRPSVLVSIPRLCGIVQNYVAIAMTRNQIINA
jgi:hypothetical protein